MSIQSYNDTLYAGAALMSKVRPDLWSSQSAALAALEYIWKTMEEDGVDSLSAGGFVFTSDDTGFGILLNVAELTFGDNDNGGEPDGFTWLTSDYRDLFKI